MNIYIPKLIDSSKAYIKDMKKKMILNNYLSNFNNRATKDFNKFLNDSNTRYKIIKSGNPIDPTLNQTMKVFSPIRNQILSNKFYTELTTDEEEKKLKKISKTGIENKKLIKRIREEQIKNSYTETEKKFREFLNNLVLEKKGLLKVKKTDNDWRKRVITNYTTQKFKEDNYILQDIIDKDQKLFNSKINDYFNEINNMKDSMLNGSKEEIRKKKQKIKVNFDNLNMLKYKKPEPIPIDFIKKAEKDEDTIELGKFVPYNKFPKSQRNKTHNYKNIDKIKNIKLDNFNQEDFSNTRKVVIGEANNLFFLKDKLDKKNEILSQNIDEDFPKIEDYNQIIRKRLDNKKKRRDENLLKNTKYLSEDEERRLRFNLTLKNNFEKWNQDPSELEGYYI